MKKIHIGHNDSDILDIFERLNKNGISFSWFAKESIREKWERDYGRKEDQKKN